MRLIFFGSFQHYSALILESLITDPRFKVVGVVTTPPTPTSKNPVHLLADQHHLPIITPEDLRDEQIPFDDNVDCFLTAGYGKILPQSWLDYPRLGSLNLHFSLLPKYRGANPAEWAIMCGETKTGITLIKMTQKLDGGDILAQSEIAIDPTDTRETLYQKLYSLGAKLLPEWLQSPLAPPKPQGNGNTPYAALLKRKDGFIPWSSLQRQTLAVSDLPSIHLKKAFKFGQQDGFKQRLPLALAGYPTLWTLIPTTKGNKRMKILSFDPYIVQVEGQQPARFNQIKNQIV